MEAKPDSSLQAGHTHVSISLSETWMMLSYTDTDRQIWTHTLTHRRKPAQTLTKSCRVRQKHTTDTQKDRATDNCCEVTHLV